VRGAMPDAAGWTGAGAGFRHVLRLDAPLAELRAGLHATHRRRLRQAERSGLRVGVGRSPSHVDAFYRLHVVTRRRQGVPVQPRRFFASLLEHVIEPGLGVVVLARTDAGTAVAGAVVLAWNGTAIVKFQASDPGAWHLHPNHLVSWCAIDWAAAGGCRSFDFGRSDEGHAGLQRWKAGWGATPIPLVYAVAGRARPAAGGHGPLASIVGAVIRRSPTPVCRALGSLFYRYAA
jgi:lipid II:glycine glycyltransferase (peptidoglycan interpeptide bridge formation enzyme)